jgi:CRP-like cAMP-binding protein
MEIHGNGTKKRRSSRPDSPIRNDVLRALFNSEYKHLLPKLERVELQFGERIYRAGQLIKYVYFPEHAVVAMIDTVEDGSTVEVGVIGHEGMVGINIFLGCLTTPDEAIVQIPGSAMRMKTSDLRKELRFGNPLRRLLLRYTQAVLAVISQLVGCSQHHTVEQRLARWFMTMHDYLGTNKFEMSHEFIAQMLGVRRVGITDAAGSFRAAGLITYSRAHIQIVDKAGLSRKSCECYRFIKQQFDSLGRDVPRFLAEKPEAVLPRKVRKTARKRSSRAPGG